MSSWEVKFKSGSTEVNVQLMDAPGPLNDWASNDPAALVPSSGTFTNQSRIVVPSAQPTWVLLDFDIDQVSVGSSGRGEMRDNDGTFPLGDFDWEVIKQI